MLSAMTRAALASGIELEYDTFGSSDDPAHLLVMGFGAQMIAWDDEFCQAIADRGRYVIRFDNRDCGLSTKCDGQSVDVGAVLATLTERTPIGDVPYDLSDMAADAVGLLDHLGIERAHIAGASMGGMIVQTIAIEYPERVLSLTSIMSTVGDPEYGEPTPEALIVLLTAPEPDRASVIAHSVNYAVWSSKRWFDAELAGQRSAQAFDRSFYPEGAPRQLAAIAASGDRSDALRSLDVPTLVIHGLDDTLIQPSGGRRTAELIPGSHLLELSDMGHDLPRPLWPVVVSAIVSHGDVATVTYEATVVAS